MNKPSATSLPRPVQFFVCLCLLVGVLGALTSGYTQKAPRPLTRQDAVEKENATTLRAKKGFKFELSGKKIVAVEVSTRRFVALSDGICGGGGKSCSALLDSDEKVSCKGCNGNSACKLL